MNVSMAGAWNPLGLVTAVCGWWPGNGGSDKNQNTDAGEATSEGLF